MYLICIFAVIKDEIGCESACDDGYFLCSEGRCLPDSLRCDGVDHCVNGDDEAACDCDVDEFKCAVSGGCVMGSKRCDGHADCADASDEWECVRMGDGGAVQVRGQRDGEWSAICGDGDGWTGDWSEKTCNQLGLSGIVATNVSSYDDQNSVVALNSTVSVENPLQGAVVEEELGGNCSSIVRLQCQPQGEFSFPIL